MGTHNLKKSKNLANKAPLRLKYAVREDRMPGGRNSGAVYNMYKVKYKKHKKNKNNAASAPNSGSASASSSPATTPHPMAMNGGQMMLPFPPPPKQHQQTGIPPIYASPPPPPPTSSEAPSPKSIATHEMMTTLSSKLTHPAAAAAAASAASTSEMYDPNPNKGLLGRVNILRAALTGSGDIPQQYKTLGQQSKEKFDEHNQRLIEELIDCDDFEDIATLKDIGDFLNTSPDLEAKLRQIGDSIVYKLVKWIRRLPFYDDLDVKVHTNLLTHKFHELVVITTTAYQAIHGHMRMGTTRTDGESVEFHQEVSTNLVTLQTCLTKLMGKPISMDQLRQDAGNMVEKITKVIAIFRQFQLKMEEYVCLKVIAMVAQEDDPSLSIIHDKYLTCLKTFTKKHFPSQPNRVEEMLVRLKEVKVAASLILESKMFYVPFLLNTSVD